MSSGPSDGVDMSDTTDMLDEVDMDVERDAALPDLGPMPDMREQDDGGDLDMLVDAGALDMSDMQDMQDMDEGEDAGMATYHPIAKFQRLRREVAPFPDSLLATGSGPDQDPSRLYFEAQLRLDPDYTNRNGYPTVDLAMPSMLGDCLNAATLTAFEIDPPETVNTSDMYVMSSLVDDNLRVVVRGSGEITLLLTGRLQVDAPTVPSGCLATSINVNAPIDFQIAMRIKTTPVMYSSFMEEKVCPIVGREGSTTSYAMRAGTPLPSRLNVFHASLDTAWPYPANADPAQQIELVVNGPDTIPTEEDARLSEWLVPETRHPLELEDHFWFDVSRSDDPITAITPVFYLPGAAGTPLALTSGETYSAFGRKANRIVAYIGELETMGGAMLCSDHFPGTHHPPARIEVTSRTPEVCRVQPLSDFARANVNPFQRLDRWHVAQDEVVIEQDGWCRLDYLFFVEDMNTPMLSVPLEVELLNTSSLFKD